MSHELQRLGHAEKKRLIQWTCDIEVKKKRTLSISPEVKGTLLNNETYRLDQQTPFDAVGTRWLNFQLQMSNATLVTVYVHAEGFEKGHITTGTILWAVKWSVKKEWEHHTLFVGYKEVGHNYIKKWNLWEKWTYKNSISKQCQPQHLTAAQICADKDIPENPGLTSSDIERKKEKKAARQAKKDTRRAIRESTLWGKLKTPNFTPQKHNASAMSLV